MNPSPKRASTLLAFTAGAILWIAPTGTRAVLEAQAPMPAVQASQEPVGRLVLSAGRSRVLTTDFDITRVAVTNPAVADATVVEARQILIDGKTSGTVSLIIWGAGQTRLQYDLVVEPQVPPLQQALQSLFPGEDITVTHSAEAVILTGRVSGNDVMLRAGEVAEATAPKNKIINLLQLPGGAGSQQVMLQVRIAEVSKRALTELGVTFFTGATGFKDYVGRVTTQQFSAPSFNSLQRSQIADDVTTSGETVFGDFLNLFLFNTKNNVGVLLKALENKGNFQSLAEPNLIAYNGQEASFLAGGELPVPVVQGVTGSVSVMWKEFGVRLNFKPTIAGDVIRLKVRPEVSSLDFASGVSIEGFRIPAIITRRAETDVELRDGQSFAIAGLMANISQDNRAAIPLLSKIPIIGKLFQSKSDSRERNELIVIVTPTLVRPLNPDEVPTLPTEESRFLKPETKDDEDAEKPATQTAPASKPAPPVRKPGGGGR